MKSKTIFHRQPLLTLLLLGLGLGLLLTALAWGIPALADSLFSGLTWLWLLLLTGAFFALVAVRLLLIEPAGRAHPKPLYLLAVLAATALVYLFPELFAPGCNGMPRAFAACPAACRITTCTNWDAPGENGCDAKPPNKGCCRSYETTCDPNCEDEDDPPDPDPTPVPVYPPSVSGSVNCALNGSNGWCRNGAALNLSASDPQGYATTLSGDIAGAAFSCAGPSCNQGLPAGSGAIHFQATSPASGLSSAVGSASFAYDPTPPTASLVVSGAAASNGWYTAASVSTTGMDTISGVDSAQVAVDGGAWQVSATLAEGTHSMVGRVLDRAGNLTLTPAQVVKVDGTSPTLSASVTSGTQVAGWYVTDVTVTATATDAVSGVDLVEYRLDGGAWQTGDELLVPSEGPHTVDFHATDLAGLSATTTLSFRVDKTAPTITFTPTGTPGSGGWYTSPVTLTITATDALSGVASVEYRLDNGSWMLGTSLVLGDGKHLVEARATDQAGNRSVVTATETIEIQVDTTLPTLSTSLDGKLGLNNWYVSEVVVSATVSDATSGVALTEYRLDTGAWTPGTSVMATTNGAHTVQFRVTDRAGNQATEQRSFQIDQTPPISGFTAPLEASTGTLAQGDFLLEGQSSDATSGLETVQISTDEGQTWLNLAVSGAGVWRYTWLTNPLENGLYPVLARAQDTAGNVNPGAHVTLLLANHPPKVSVQESWWVWEAGKLMVQERFLPVTEISVRIACLDGQPDVKLNFTLESLPDFLQWDRKCGEGQFATSGNHLVTLKACDQVGNCASAEGTIKVPFIAPPIPTWTPTPLPTVTATPLPTHKPRQPTPSPTRMTLVPTQEPTPETPVEKPAIPNSWLWPPVALLGLLLAFGSSSLLDPRPAALRRLRQVWEKIADVHE